MEAKSALKAARRILEKLGVSINTEKTRIVHTGQGFEFLGYKIKRGSRRLDLPAGKIKSGAQQGNLYAYPSQKSVEHFRDQIRRMTRRRASVNTAQLIKRINPVIRGWGNYYNIANVRRLFHHLDSWIVRRLWSHRYKHWRNQGWKDMPEVYLYKQLGLANLFSLIPSFAACNTSL